MKAIQKMKRMVAFLLVLIACLCVCEVSVQATSGYTKKVTKKNEKFTLSAEYGLGGLVYYEMPTMVSVTVECKENFTGTLRVIPEDYTMSTVAYGEDISLSAGEPKTFQFVPTSLGYNGKIEIEVLNEKGKVVYGESHEILLQGGGDKVTVGILSDDYSALSYMDGIGVEIDGEPGTTSIFELTKENFPEDAKALAMLQYMVIDNFDTASLSQEQYNALKLWVQDGGILILGLGSNYQNVLHCFTDSFITGTLGTLEKKDVTWNALQDASAVSETVENSTETNLSEQTTVETTDEEASEQSTSEETDDVEDVVNGCSLNMDCIEFQLDGGEPLSEDTTEGSVYTKKIGMGRVVVLAYSIGMEPMTSSSNRKSIAKFIVDGAEVSATSSKFYGNDSERNTMSAGLNVAEIADTSQKPSAILYGVILLIYVILVGPILYLILKKMNKRESIWVAIPIVALIFTAVIYATGFLYRINKPLVSTFTLIQLQDGVKSEKIYTSIVCPKPKEYEIQFAEGYTGFRKDVDDYSYSLFGGNMNASSFDYMLKENSKGTEVLFDTSEPFQKTKFLINKNSDNNIGTLDSDLTCSTTGFEGTVTNNTCYDLKDVVVTFENYLCMVGDIKKGETATIDSSKIVGMSSYGSFEKLYPENRRYLDKEMYLRYRINDMVESNLINKKEFNKGYVWACMSSYKPDMVDGSDVKRAGCGVILNSYTAEYSDVKGTFYPSIDELEIAAQGEYDIYDRSIYSSEVVITYSFEDFHEVTELQNMTLKENNSDTHRKPADVYAYNPATDDYEQIFVDGKALKGEELKKYMLDDMLMLKYVQSQTGTDYYGCYIPRICARGEE